MRPRRREQRRSHASAPPMDTMRATAAAAGPERAMKDVTIFYNPRCSKSRATLALLR
jgi:hypothetical protein